MGIEEYNYKNIHPTVGDTDFLILFKIVKALIKSFLPDNKVINISLSGIKGLPCLNLLDIAILYLPHNKAKAEAGVQKLKFQKQTTTTTLEEPEFIGAIHFNNLKFNIHIYLKEIIDNESEKFLMFKNSVLKEKKLADKLILAIKKVIFKSPIDLTQYYLLVNDFYKAKYSSSSESDVVII